jgi:hypothetical protein
MALKTRQPGLDFDTNSAGNNQLTGHFAILEANITNGAVVSFAADFTHHDEGAAASWVYGSVGTIRPSR